MNAINFLDGRLPPRFWSKVQPCPMSGCWIWTGAPHSAGYGIFNIRVGDVKRTLYAHRYSYEALVGSIDPGLQIDHLCRVRHCVNPAHLEPVTQAENIRRGDGASARNAAVTHCPRGHAYADDNLHIAPDGARRCRACVKAHNARHPNRRRGREPVA